MNVTVTAEDIQQGKPGSPCECPVALAIKRATGIAHVSVSPSTARVGDIGDTNTKWYRLPQPVREFIHNVDYGEGPHAPFTFSLEG
jgi:hypothetical protein